MDFDSALACPTAAPLPPSTGSTSSSTGSLTSDASSFAHVLLDDGAGSTRNLRRLGAGLALSAVFGLAIGARYGLASMAVHAAGVPLGLLAVAGLAAPPFYVGIAHANLPLDGAMLIEAVARGVATSGLVLAGLAPAALLLTVSTESPLSAAAMGAAGLAVGGALGLRQLMGGLLAPLDDPEQMGRRAGHWLTSAFAVFITLLAMRVWWLALPMLGRSVFTGGT